MKHSSYSANPALACRSRHDEETPFTRDALESMGSVLAEVEAGARDEILDSARHEDLSRFRLRFELGDRTGRRLYHWLDDGVRFVVYPGEGARGPVLLAGTWSLEEIGAPAEIYTEPTSLFVAEAIWRV